MHHSLLVKNLRVVTALLAVSLLLGLAQDAPTDPTPAPHYFGIQDHEITPIDPREYNHGEFADFPRWPVSKDLPNDVFTFARLRYPSFSDGRFGRGGRYFAKWAIDYPGTDINLPYRLQQTTAIQVDPNGAIVDIEAEQMRHYPFIYMLEVGHIDISDEQAKVMRDYMLNGGFIMVDDFWGDREWEVFERAFKQIWPDRNFVELELDHDIFHCVFDLKVKPQIPGIGFAERARRSGSGRFYEYDKPGSETVHYRAVYDDQKRMCMVIGWNTDLGDGWEEEGTDPWYFREFSEKYAFPLGINIVFYALTH